MISKRDFPNPGRTWSPWLTQFSNSPPSRRRAEPSAALHAGQRSCARGRAMILLVGVPLIAMAAGLGFRSGRGGRYVSDRQNAYGRGPGKVLITAGTSPADRQDSRWPAKASTWRPGDARVEGDSEPYRLAARAGASQARRRAHTISQAEDRSWTRPVSPDIASKECR